MTINKALITAGAPGVKRAWQKTELLSSDPDIHVPFSVLSDLSGRGVAFDNLFKAMLMISPGHHEIHEAQFFECSNQLLLGSGVTQDYMFTTPDSEKWAHWGFQVDSIDGPVTIALIEGGDRDGDVLSQVRGRNRNGLDVSTMLVHKGITGGTTDGVIIHPTSGGAERIGARNTIAESGSVNEHILKENDKTIFRLVNQHNANNNIFVSFGWYEHTGE